MKGSSGITSSIFSKANGTDAQHASIGDNGHGSSTVVSNGLRGYSRGSKVS
jgi:hypothetical protein